jgi:hypothetical protein
MSDEERSPGIAESSGYTLHVHNRHGLDRQEVGGSFVTARIPYDGILSLGSWGIVGIAGSCWSNRRVSLRSLYGLYLIYLPLPFGSTHHMITRISGGKPCSRHVYGLYVIYIFTSDRPSKRRSRLISTYRARPSDPLHCSAKDLRACRHHHHHSTLDHRRGVNHILLSFSSFVARARV